MQASSTTDTRITLTQAALELVWPTRCAGCERPGSLFCEDCNGKLRRIAREHACPVCGAPYGALVCTECYSSEGKQHFAFSAAVSPLEMDELTGRLVVLYKDHDERRLSALIAAHLAEQIPPSWLAWADVLTWIPADKKALRRRGFDHMQKIAHELAEQTGLRTEKLLEKRYSQDQRGLGRAQRSANLLTSFSLCKKVEALAPHILLIDDVFTTGATFDAAAALLTQNGAREVRLASYVRVW
jgi:ComF family protein